MKFDAWRYMQDTKYAEAYDFSVKRDVVIFLAVCFWMIGFTVYMIFG